LVEVTLPSLGESVTEGIITRWFKQVGEYVNRDEPLFEVSTDKVDSEMPSPAAGVLVQILAGDGDTVETGARVAVIDENADPGSVVAPTTPTPTATASAGPRSTPTTSAPSGSAGIVVSPVVRRILSGGRVEASTVVGTGPGGQITRRDAERAVALGPTEEVVVSLSSQRRRMGQHMMLSAFSIPHGFVSVEVDAELLGALRRQPRDLDGLPVSGEAVVVRALVDALEEFEELNATWMGDTLTVQRSLNIGVVRHGSPEGMVIPVVHAATHLDVDAIERRLRELDQLREARQLGADDLLGGTFTLMSSPSPHTVVVTPLIIAPQVAALSVGTPRVVAAFDESGAVVPRDVVTLGLSFDHRVCDPMIAAQFLERVGQGLKGSR
jgi:2-oxoglutarate dehydrogenase E2 component (dihydrolipoamide succinyltransferase)